MMQMQNKNLAKAITAFILFIFSAVPASYSIPVPHGVDGTILELDGITKVTAGTDFYVKTTTTATQFTARQIQTGRILYH